MTALGQLFGQHVPRNRYDDEGAPVGTYCVCGGWCPPFHCREDRR